MKRDKMTLPAYDDYQYTQLPDDLRAALTAYLSEKGLTDKSPQAIAAHVQQTGVYDLNTPRVPEGEDFALYFLTQSHQGYCVHFASATVLLLRAQGVPARYVTGYSVSGSSGTWNEVTEDETHAWVEYYWKGVGWQYLDPTPADWRATPAPETPDVPDTPEVEEPPVADEPTPEEEEPPVTPEPSDPETPEQSDPGEEPDGAAPGQGFHLLKELLHLLWLPGLWALLEVRRRLVLYLRHRRCTTRSPNQCMLALWQWLEQLCRAGKREPADTMRALAEKARFSQHTVTEAELAQMKAAVKAEISLRQQAPLLGRLWYRYGSILY